MRFENVGWGAPKIHGELLKLGFHISERTVGRYLRRLHPRQRDGSQKWLAFALHHREVIVAYDAFTVPTLTFKLLHCFLVIEHGRRKVLHCSVTPHPTSDWVLQQLRETFPEAHPYRCALFDHDSKFNSEVTSLLRSTGLEPKRPSIQAPWQNGVAERWIGSCRRELLDHAIPLNEPHLRRLLCEYVSYHNDDRIHEALYKDPPNPRPVEDRPSEAVTITSSARLGGVYQRYGWSTAAGNVVVGGCGLAGKGSESDQGIRPVPA